MKLNKKQYVEICKKIVALIDDENRKKLDPKGYADLYNIRVLIFGNNKLKISDIYEYSESEEQTQNKIFKEILNMAKIEITYDDIFQDNIPIDYDLCNDAFQILKCDKEFNNIKKEITCCFADFNESFKNSLYNVTEISEKSKKIISENIEKVKIKIIEHELEFDNIDK